MRILVIEDESKVANFVKKGLEQSGYEVDIAADGEEGFDKFRAVDYDLVLLDLMLPKITGWELIPLLRKRKPTLPIIAVTAKTAVEDRVQGLNLGCDDYLVKPFSFAELLARIQVQLRRGITLGTAELRAADLVLDPLKRKVTRAGKAIELSNKEFALLEYLLRNKDEIVTRNMIVENVWDSSFDNFTNVVDVYINYLRNKVDRGFDHAADPDGARCRLYPPEHCIVNVRTLRFKFGITNGLLISVFFVLFGYVRYQTFAYIAGAEFRERPDQSSRVFCAQHPSHARRIRIPVQRETGRCHGAGYHQALFRSDGRATGG